MTSTRKYLMTGATGYLGATALYALIQDTSSDVVLLIRRINDQDIIINDLRMNFEGDGEVFDECCIERLSFIQFSSVQNLEEALAKASLSHIDEIIHCAGCVDYYDKEKLTVGNVDFTQKLINFAQLNNIGDFLYLSTSLSSGYLPHEVPESLHEEPGKDPTVYTNSKRQAEWIVADSGLSYRILRPTIVIGDSRTGRYTGKRYGLYQTWVGFENLLCDRYHETIHLIGPEQPLNFIHQDAFKNTFSYALKNLEPKSIIHLTSNLDAAPTMRDVWVMWLRRVACPKEVVFYEKFDDIPLKSIPTRQRAYLTFAAINLEIASYPWRFKTTHLDRFRSEGFEFADASLETIGHCQERFVTSSEKISRYLDQYSQNLSTEITLTEAKNTLENARY